MFVKIGSWEIKRFSWESSCETFLFHSSNKLVLKKNEPWERKWTQHSLFFSFFFVDKNLLKGYFSLRQILFSILFRLLMPTFATDLVMFEPFPSKRQSLESLLKMWNTKCETLYLFLLFFYIRIKITDVC